MTKPAKRLRTVIISGVMLGAVLLAVWPRQKPAPTNAPEPAAARERYPNPYKAPAPPDVTRLLDGLVRGTRLDGGFVVRGVSPPQDGHVIIDVQRGDIGFRVWLSKRNADARRPPASSQRYALFVVQPRPTAEAVTDEMTRVVLQDLVRRLKKTESRVAVPEGL